MTTVFLSGSRKLGRLNGDVKARLDTMVDKGFKIFVGDANGADKAFQTYLSDSNFENVTVFCSGARCRNNVGGWETHNVEVDPKLSGRAFYTAKDKVMAELSDYGFILWDGKSLGSITNALEMISKNKKVVVFYSPNRAFLNVKGFDDIHSLIDQAPFDQAVELKRKIKLSALQDNFFQRQQSEMAF